MRPFYYEWNECLIYSSSQPYDFLWHLHSFIKIPSGKKGTLAVYSFPYRNKSSILDNIRIKISVLRDIRFFSLELKLYWLIILKYWCSSSKFVFRCAFSYLHFYKQHPYCFYWVCTSQILPSSSSNESQSKPIQSWFICCRCGYRHYLHRCHLKFCV